MPTTSIFDIPYPDPTDRPSASQLRAIAEALEAALVAVGQVEETTSGAVPPASGWQVNSFQAIRIGRVCTVRYEALRSGTAWPIVNDELGMGPNGNFADETVGTLPAGWRPVTLINTVWGTGSIGGECTINTSGVISLRSGVPTGVVNTNNIVRVSASYVLQ